MLLMNSNWQKMILFQVECATIKSRANLAGMSQKEIDSFEAAGILDAMIEHY